MTQPKRHALELPDAIVAAWAGALGAGEEDRKGKVGEMIKQVGEMIKQVGEHFDPTLAAQTLLGATYASKPP